MRVFVFGDSNVDVTVKWQEAEARLKQLSPKTRKLVSDNMAKCRRYGTDVEHYLPARNEDLSQFFDSLNPRVEFGGCGAIKARMMARMGHDVTLYSWVGDDERGRMILSELSKAGVDTSNVQVTGDTCETLNFFDPGEARLALSFWMSKLDFSEFIKAVKREKPDKVFLAGAHRIKKGLGYFKLPGAYVFTGSFASYTKKQLELKYKEDFSKGILVGNETEMMQLAGVNDPIQAMLKLKNKVVVVHMPDVTAVKRRGEIITLPVPPKDRSKVIELTGVGDVWESFFLGSIDDIEEASEKKIKASMLLASKASIYRMMTGRFPLPRDVR